MKIYKFKKKPSSVNQTMSRGLLKTLRSLTLIGKPLYSEQIFNRITRCEMRNAKLADIDFDIFDRTISILTSLWPPLHNKLIKAYDRICYLKAKNRKKMYALIRDGK